MGGVLAHQILPGELRCECSMSPAECYIRAGMCWGADPPLLASESHMNRFNLASLVSNCFIYVEVKR